MILYLKRMSKHYHIDSSFLLPLWPGARMIFKWKRPKNDRPRDNTRSRTCSKCFPCQAYQLQSHALSLPPSYNCVPIRRRMYFTQFPTFTTHASRVLWFVSHSTCVCFVLEIQKKVKKKNIEIEVISRQIVWKGRKRVKERKDRGVA